MTVHGQSLYCGSAFFRLCQKDTEPPNPLRQRNAVPCFHIHPRRIAVTGPDHTIDRKGECTTIFLLVDSNMIVPPLPVVPMADSLTEPDQSPEALMIT
jgi:hypothetical protein